MKLIKFLCSLYKKLVKKSKKVINCEVKECCSVSDKISTSKEIQKLSSISLRTSSNMTKSNELNWLTPDFLSECEWILSKLTKAGKLHYHKKFFKILQRHYSNEFKGPLDFEKVKNKLAQARLLTKTVSEYLSFESKSTKSIEQYFSNHYPIYKIHIFRVNCPTRYESAWIDEGIIYINEGHSAYKRARRQYKYYHDLVSAANAIVRYTNKIKINGNSFLNQNFKNIAALLTERERDILFRRYFAKNPQSLKAIGQHYGLSRERIRQIEKEALIKLRENGLHIMFLFELIRRDAPSILHTEQLTAISEDIGITSENPFCLLKITSKIINEIIGDSADFNFYPLNSRFIYLQYYNYPPISKLSIKKWIDKTQILEEEFRDYLINEGFGFLTEHEFGILYNYFSEQHRNKASLKDLIIRSLKLIGYPAHYSDITERVRKIGGEKYKNCSYNSVHGALNHYDEFVWVGKKGVYGLKEWGLSPPDKGLEDQIYNILSDSEKPLSKESIAIELSKQRPYFTETSLNLILSVSSKIIKTPNNLYRAVTEKDIDEEELKEVQRDKMSNAMEEVFEEWKEQKNSE